ncbi:MAG: hypothetical protein HY557_03675 [Euryarchaeota archaeon]|nr:hypothetical protein [Euryarchaeota archaeon]
MSGETFVEVRRQVFALYGEGRYREALDLVSSARQAFPDQDGTMSFWTACLQSRLGLADEAVATLRDARGRGRWWSAQQLEDGDLDLIRGRTDFQAIVADCEKARAAAQAETKPELIVRTPPGAHRGPFPVLFALHGRAGNARDFEVRWAPALNLGFLLALPQSSQLFGPDAFAWDDRDLATRELADAHATVLASHPADGNRLVFAGFSQGAALAIRLCLQGEPFASRGFVAVAPSAYRDPDAVAALVHPAARRGVRGWIVTGETDYARPSTETLHAEMTRRGLACSLDVRQGLGHEFPPDFPSILEAALLHILGP